MTHDTRRSRVRDTLIGPAAGDRIGGPGRMAMRPAKSLADGRRFDPDDMQCSTRMCHIRWPSNGPIGIRGG